MQKLCLLPFILGILLTSCQRDVEGTLPEESPDAPEQRDSTLFRKYVEIDYSNPAGQGDSIAIYSWKYDDQKRVIEYIEDEPDPDWGTVIVTKYYYKSVSDKWPFLAVQRLTSVKPSENRLDSMFLTYEGGFVKKDSVRYCDPVTYEYHGYSVHDVAINGTEVEITNRSGNANDPSVTSSTFHVSVFRDGGNIMKVLGSNWNLDAEYNYSTYNNHPDPMYRCYLPFYFNYQGSEWGLEAYKNLLTEYREEDTPGTTDFLYRMAYTYRADGYPITSSFEDVIGGIGEKGTEVYIYY